MLVEIREIPAGRLSAFTGSFVTLIIHGQSMVRVVVSLSASAGYRSTSRHQPSQSLTSRVSGSRGPGTTHNVTVS